MLELQYEPELKAAKRSATTDIASVFFTVPLAAKNRPQFAFTWRGVQYSWNQLPQEWKHSPTICHGLLQTALERSVAPNICSTLTISLCETIKQNNCLRREKSNSDPLKAGFAIKRGKVKGPAQEIHFLGLKWQDECCHMPMDVIYKITAMSPAGKKKETQALWDSGECILHIIVNPLY